jgi:dephospho-CoA kinase
VILLALTGGIGSGKSSVASRLAHRGAVVLDADAIVRSLQEPGQPVFKAMVDHWGPRIVWEDGSLNRQAVAHMVFNDSDELATLEAMIHPEVRAEMTRRITGLALSAEVVVQDIPLLDKVMGGRRTGASVVVVDCPVELAVDRLVDFRGFNRDDAEARLAAQISRSDRLAMADFVIDNGGDLQQLDAEVERCWQWLQALPPTPWPPEAINEP